ncbi:hypothetical protein [Massilia genomosp. 1]|uniref:Uncharacterized protein n=1 Tax=Massilia genomosp. 1 TaxID=2609280 RepID=A0ABX0MPK4_9BURK|nr:hypothetical protein [Massilia genomosp. 1]NHZ62515.1 hypothetical protein [Massilia genomosp. 1]
MHQLAQHRFIIGQGDQLSEAAVAMPWFSGTGRWDDELAAQAFADIAWCQVNTNDIKFDQRYVERTADRP